MTPAEIRAYYSRPEILEELFKMCRGREIIPVFAGGVYGKRPNSVQFKGDLLYFIRNGAVSFHSSVEHWRNPESLSNDLKRQELDKLRTGWDFVLDIDSDAGIEAAKITAKLLINELQKHGVKNISVKFSGRRGFHIGIAEGAFPKEVNDYEDIGKMFPEIPQKIASYLCSKIKSELAKKLLSLDPSLEERMKEQSGEFNPYNVVEVEQNWSVRHLFRMPYSLNDKTWNVSLPINPDKIMEFSPDEAKPEKVRISARFLENFEKNEAELLVKNALDFDADRKSKATVAKNKDGEKNDALMRILMEDGATISRESSVPKDEALKLMLKSGFRKKAFSANMPKVPEEAFPPCIKKILLGLPDGRKRAIFILINFFRTVGWGWEEIEQKLNEWNAKNPEAIPESYLKGQIEYAKKQDKKILPPNCDNAGYYKDIKVCIPDNYCAAIKNPAAYAARKAMLGRRGGTKKAGSNSKKGTRRIHL